MRAARRISRGTPYVLTTSEVENLLGSLTPRMEEQIAAMLGMDLESWRKQPKGKRAKQIVDFQNRGLFAAAMAASAKAHTDMESAAFAVTQQTEAASVVEEVAGLKMLVADIATRMDHLTGNVAKKGA